MVPAAIPGKPTNSEFSSPVLASRNGLAKKTEPGAPEVLALKSFER